MSLQVGPKDMTCVFGGSPTPAVQDGHGENRLHFRPASQEMAERLTGILADHRVVFERRSGLVIVSGPEKHERIVALLRQMLNEAERRAVSVFDGDGSQFPVLRLIDEWWRVHETQWFAKAMEENRFVTWFQPIVDTGPQRVIGHECLIRLPWGRMYSGAEILDAAWLRDELGAFDSYARGLAIRSAAKQSLEGRYFVNFMPSSICNPELCLQNTLQTLRDSGLRPENVIFEVVEAELAREPVHLQRIVDFFRSHGFGVALDDVGAGAESARLLSNLRPDFVKLGKAAVQNAESPLHGPSIKRLAEMSERLGVTVIAKGVESAQTMENLWLLGVQAMQGYLFGRAMPQISPVESDLFNLERALERHYPAAVQAVH